MPRTLNRLLIAGAILLLALGSSPALMSLAIVMFSPNACKHVEEKKQYYNHGDFTGVIAKPHTRLLAVTLSYEENEELNSISDIFADGPAMKFLAGGGRLYLYDVDTKTLTLLAEFRFTNVVCLYFRCELAGWVDDDIYIRLKLWKVAGIQEQLIRVDPRGVQTTVETLPSNIVTRDLPWQQGGLVMCGGHDGSVSIVTSSVYDQTVLLLDKSTFTAVQTVH